MQKSRVILQLNSPSQTINITPNLNYTKVSLEELSIPHIWYPIPEGQIIFHDSANVSHTINNPPSANDVINAMTSLTQTMTSLETAGAIYSYVINYQYYTITIQSTAFNFGLVFTPALALKLGINTPSTVNTGYYGFDHGGGSTFTTGRFNFTTQQLFINFSISIAGMGTSYDNLSQPLSTPAIQTQPSSYMFNFPVRSLPGEIETLYLGDLAIDYKLTSGQQSLSIRVTDENGSLIDVSPQNMYVVLVYSC